MSRDSPNEVIDHIRQIDRWGSIVRKITAGRVDEIETAEVSSPRGAALFLTWLVKGSAHERATDGAMPLTKATLDEIADRCRWNELGKVLRGEDKNPREQQMMEAQEAADLFREVAGKEENDLDDAVEALKNRPVADGAGPHTFRDTCVSPVTDPEDFFADQRPDWLKRAHKEARDETEGQILEAISLVLVRQRAAGIDEIHAEIEKDVSREWVRQVLDEKAEEWGLEKIDHPDPDDGRGNPQAYIPEGEEPTDDDKPLVTDGGQVVESNDDSDWNPEESSWVPGVQPNVEEHPDSQFSQDVSVRIPDDSDEAVITSTVPEVNEALLEHESARFERATTCHGFDDRGLPRHKKHDTEESAVESGRIFSLTCTVSLEDLPEAAHEAIVDP